MKVVPSATDMFFVETVWIRSYVMYTHWPSQLRGRGGLRCAALETIVPASEVVAAALLTFPILSVMGRLKMCERNAQHGCSKLQASTTQATKCQFQATPLKSQSHSSISARRGLSDCKHPGPSGTSQTHTMPHHAIPHMPCHCARPPNRGVRETLG